METLLPFQNEDVRTHLFGAMDWYAALPSEYSDETQRVQEEEWLLSTKLGPLGAQRVRDFQTYPSYWGDGSHRSYSSGALRRMVRFLKQFTFPEGIVPSVFFTREGGFELEWDNDRSEAVQVEFSPDRIEVYHAGKGIDVDLEVTAQDQLLSLLN